VCRTTGSSERHIPAAVQYDAVDSGVASERDPEANPSLLWGRILRRALPHVLQLDARKCPCANSGGPASRLLGVTGMCAHGHMGSARARPAALAGVGLSAFHAFHALPCSALRNASTAGGANQTAVPPPLDVR